MHRYGRHGPRAWLKWRKRHYRLPSSVPVPVNRQLMIFRIRIPPEAERALIVLEPSDERQEITIMSTFPTPLRLPEPEENENVRIAAKRRATSAVNKLRQQEKPVVIDWEQLEVYVKEYEAEDYFCNIAHSFPDESKEMVIQLYWDSYRQLFWEAYRQLFAADDLPTIDDETDRKLYQLAKKDSNNPPSVRSDGRVAFHKEHGSIIRALEAMGIISESVYEQLDRGDIHDKADKYSLFYQNHGEMVVCPDDTFRRWY
jgi:hypothetical protein